MARDKNVESNPASGEVSGDPVIASPGDERVLPSDIEGLARQFNLTMPEAERLAAEHGKFGDAAAADDMKAARRIYRVRYESVPATANPLAVADREAAVDDLRASAAAEDRKRLEAAATAPTIDSTQPESGPHGPFADYEQVEVKPEEVASQTPGLSVDEAREVVK